MWRRAKPATAQTRQTKTHTNRRTLRAETHAVAEKKARLSAPLEVAAMARETRGQSRGGQGPGEIPNMDVAELRVSA